MQILDIKNFSPVQISDVCHQIAAIEAILQPFDAWHDNLIADTLAVKFNHGLVILKNGEVYCYCLYHQLFETAEILRIGTLPSRQRQGLASKILQALKAHLRDIKVEELLLEVREDNNAAIKLYNSMCFTVIHRRQGYYSNEPKAGAHESNKHEPSDDTGQNQKAVSSLSAVDALVMKCLL